MSLTTKEEEILKAEIAIKIARKVLNTEMGLLHDEIKAAFVPIEQPIQDAHAVKLAQLRADLQAARDVLANALK